MRDGFQPANAVGQRQAGQQRQRKLAPIVVVELELGQQIAQRDTQKSSRCKS